MCIQTHSLTHTRKQRERERERERDVYRYTHEHTHTYKHTHTFATPAAKATEHARKAASSGFHASKLRSRFNVIMRRLSMTSSTETLDATIAGPTPTPGARTWEGDRDDHVGARRGVPLGVSASLARVCGGTVLEVLPSPGLAGLAPRNSRSWCWSWCTSESFSPRLASASVAIPSRRFCSA